MIFLDRSWVDTFQLAFRQDAEQVPAKVEGRVDITILVESLVDELLLEIVRETQVEFVSGGEGGDGMGDVISWHGENRHLCDRALATVKSSCSFVYRAQVCVHVAWISSASRDLFSGCRNLSESFRIVRHVGENDEDVGSEFDCEILSGGQCESRGQDSFDGGIVGEVDEHGHVVESALFLEVVSE